MLTLCQNRTLSLSLTLSVCVSPPSSLSAAAYGGCVSCILLVALFSCLQVYTNRLRSFIAAFFYPQVLSHPHTGPLVGLRRGHITVGALRRHDADSALYCRERVGGAKEMFEMADPEAPPTTMECPKFLKLFTRQHTTRQHHSIPHTCEKGHPVETSWEGALNLYHITANNTNIKYTIS